MEASQASYLVIILEPNPRHVIHHLSFISITDNKSQ